MNTCSMATVGTSAMRMRRSAFATAGSQPMRSNSIVVPYKGRGDWDGVSTLSRGPAWELVQPMRSNCIVVPCIGSGRMLGHTMEMDPNAEPKHGVQQQVVPTSWAPSMGGAKLALQTHRPSHSGALLGRGRLAAGPPFLSELVTLIPAPLARPARARAPPATANC